MIWRFAGGLCAAAVLPLAMAVFSETTVDAQAANPAAQERTPPAPQERTPAAAQQPTSPSQQVTVTGCIQREADFRKARDAGRGGAVGTGIGVGNEFILADASMAPSATSTRGAGAPAPAATTGGSDAFELSGRDESKAEQYVGKRVEISGTLKAAETAGGKPTGGPTAGRPPEGVDIVGRDLQLRELEISSIKGTSGTCAK